MMRAVMVSLLFFMIGCGNVQPTIESVRVSNPRVQRFQEFFITLVNVEDPDGNVYEGKVKMKATQDGEELEEEVEPFAGEPVSSKGDIIFGATLGGDLPLGNWAVSVKFEDEGGSDSEPAVTRFDLTR
jgi:hypothetical protein